MVYIIDKSLPIIGVIIGAVLSPIIIEVVGRSKEKIDANANFIELIYRYFSAKRGYYGAVNSIVRDRSNHHYLGEKLKKISHDTAEGRMLANDHAILERQIWEGRERKLELGAALKKCSSHTVVIVIRKYLRIYTFLLLLLR